MDVSDDFIKILDENMSSLIDVMRRFRSGKTVRAGRRQIDALCKNYITNSEILGNYSLMCAPVPSVQKLFVERSAATSFKQLCVEMEEDKELHSNEYYTLNECEAIDAYETGETAIAYEYLTIEDRYTNSWRLINADNDVILIKISEQTYVVTLSKGLMYITMS
ncbi:hypothetical protein GJ496_011087 [Pomphorhynchus laevis]|nr:hypothetical protein GJ496_005105 [Pomphorhynchus laevis]KAI0987870.1 hypothetical protein GJ496_011087 [Pomphorhynchus laevis]